MPAPSLTGIYGDNVKSLLRLGLLHEIGVLKQDKRVVFLTQMRNSEFMICESVNPLELTVEVEKRRIEIDIADVVLGVMLAVLFQHYYVTNN